MEQRPDLKSLSCVNEECKDFGQKGRKNLKIRKTYGKDRVRYLRCKSCGEEFSERKGTALYNSKIRESKAASIIDHPPGPHYRTSEQKASQQNGL
jgi:hypothetical protein